MIRVINSPHWKLRLFASRSILNTLVFSEGQITEERHTVPITGSLITQITYIIKFVLEINLRDRRVLDSCIDEGELISMTSALLHEIPLLIDKGKLFSLFLEDDSNLEIEG